MKLMDQCLEKLRKMWDDGYINWVTVDRIANYLLSDRNYKTTKFFTQNLSAIETTKSEIFMNKPAYLGHSVLELSKINNA